MWTPFYLILNILIELDDHSGVANYSFDKISDLHQNILSEQGFKSHD